MAAGIETRHARSCRQRQGGRCNCEPTYRVRLWDGQRQQRIVKPFQSYAEAQGWRKDALISLRRGRTPDTGSDTLQAAADSWLEGARQGVIRTRSGDPYKPAAIRSYEASLRLRVLPELGTEPLADIRRADLQDLVERLAAEGVAENTIEATFIPLRSIFRREVHRDRLKVNPCAGLELPKAKTRRDRIASPVEGARLLAALPQGDRRYGRRPCMRDSGAVSFAHFVPTGSIFPTGSSTSSVAGMTARARSRPRDAIGAGCRSRQCWRSTYSTRRFAPGAAVTISCSGMMITARSTRST